MITATGVILENSNPRINLNKVVGVRNLDDYVNKWELDFVNATFRSKEPCHKNQTEF